MATRFYIYLGLILLGFIIGLFKYKQLSWQLKGVVLLLGFTFCSEVVGRILIKQIHNSNPVYHFYSPVEALLLGLILYNISRKALNQRIIVVVFGIVVLFSIVNSIFFQGWLSFNSNVDQIKMPLTVLAGIIVLMELPIVKSKRPDLVILIALLCFNTASFLFIISHNYLVSKGISTKSIGVIHYISNIIYYSLLLLSIVLYKKRYASGQ